MKLLEIIFNEIANDINSDIYPTGSQPPRIYSFPKMRKAWAPGSLPLLTHSLMYNWYKYKI